MISKVVNKLRISLANSSKKGKKSLKTLGLQRTDSESTS